VLEKEHPSNRKLYEVIKLAQIAKIETVGRPSVMEVKEK